MNNPLIRLLFLAHLGSTLFMVGLIWFVQVVLYPLFANVGNAEFAAYEQRHTALVTWVVAPAMVIEAATAVLLVWIRPAAVPSSLLWTSLALLAVVWLSTALLQVPCHDALSRGYDSLVHQRLVSTNWMRTSAWSLRGILVLWIAWAALR